MLLSRKKEGKGEFKFGKQAFPLSQRKFSGSLGRAASPGKTDRGKGKGIVLLVLFSQALGVLRGRGNLFPHPHFPERRRFQNDVPYRMRVFRYAQISAMEEPFRTRSQRI